MRKLHINFSAFIVFAILLNGCGDSTTQEDAVSETIHTFYEERLYGDAALAYEFLDSETKSECDRTTFIRNNETNQSIARRVGHTRTFTLESLYQDGDRATATVRVVYAAGSVAFHYSLVREDGEWRIDYDCGQNQ